MVDEKLKARIEKCRQLGTRLSRNMLKVLDDGEQVYIFERDIEHDEFDDILHTVDTLIINGKEEKVLMEDSGRYYLVRNIDARELEITFA